MHVPLLPSSIGEEAGGTGSSRIVQLRIGDCVGSSGISQLHSRTILPSRNVIVLYGIIFWKFGVSDTSKWTK